MSKEVQKPARFVMGGPLTKSPKTGRKVTPSSELAPLGAAPAPTAVSPSSTRDTSGLGKGAAEGVVGVVADTLGEVGRYSSVGERDKEIVRLKTEGHLIGEISKETGIIASTVRNVLERKGMLDWDPIKLMGDLDDLKKKFGQETQETRNRYDVLTSSLEAFKNEVRGVVKRIPPVEEADEEESGPEFTEMGSSPMISSSFPSKGLKLPTVVYLYYDYMRGKGYEGTLEDFLGECVKGFFEKVLKLRVTMSQEGF